MNRNISIALLLAASITVPVGAQANSAQRPSSGSVVTKTPARSDAPPVVSNAPQDARQDGRKAAPQDAPTMAQGAVTERAAEPVDFHSAARAGEVALQSGDFAGAAAAYEAALAARPDAADAAYNLGVALYKAGKYQDAAKAFARASTSASNGEHTDAALSASSLYNRAASFYSATRTQAEAAQRMLETQREATGTEPKEGQEAAIDPEALKQAIADANKSLGGFKDAAYADPNDQESRANAEQSLRLVRALEELKKQQDEQKKKDDKENKDDKQDQSDKKDQSDKQDQSDKKNQGDKKDQNDKQDQKDKQNPSDKKDQDDKQDQGDKKDESDKKEKDDKKNQDDKKDKGDQDKQDPKEQQNKDGKSPNDQQPPEQPKPGEPGQPKDGQMTKDQADRLLQSVRDHERERRAAQERKVQAEAARGRKPIKDW